MAERLENLSSGTPKPNANRFDKFAMRAFLPIIAFIAWGYSYGAGGGRLIDGFVPHIDSAKILSRLDVWASSPTYSGKPPLYLSANISNSAENGRQETLKLLSGSTFNLRYIGKEQVSSRYHVGDTLVPVENMQSTTDPRAKVDEFAFALPIDTSGTVEFLVRDKIIAAWPIEITPDRVPSIAFESMPKSALSGSLELAYSVEDDYGVISARGIVRSLEEDDPDARPLVEAPQLDLPLPRARARTGTSKVNRDLSAHPWAGGEVEITLEAKDDPGQLGLSNPFKMVLPGRRFTDKMAMALVEERRILALNANRSRYVADLLDAVTQFPEEFKIDAKAYLALRTAYRMISSAKSDARLRDAMDILWETALALEFGDLSEVERKLREAQERLSEALKNDASDEEIQKLMEELRQAMNEFLEEMQRQMAENPAMQNPLDNFDPSQMLTQRDLERMMDQIENLARSGSKDAARELLSQLQRMMDNLRAGQQQQRRQAQGNQLNQALDKLSELMDKQQQLMDETFSMQRRDPNSPQNRQQQGNQQGQQPGENKDMTPEEFAEAMRQLQQQQQQLQDQLGELGKELEGLGLDPSKEFGEAGREMGEAGDNLGKGEAGPAAGDQGQALQALRQGAQTMMQQMAGERGPGGRQQGQAGRDGQSRQRADPLGRSQDGNARIGDGNTKIPSEIDAQRAREIMEAIRKRLSDPLRPSLEKNYLERLLESQ